MTPQPSGKTKRGSATESDLKSEKRKVRNRISQQAFRARQSLKVQELEERLQDMMRPDAARMAELQDQNTALRDQLLECHKKLTSFEVSIQDLKRQTVQVLGIVNTGDTSTVPEVLGGDMITSPPRAGTNYLGSYRSMTHAKAELVEQNALPSPTTTFDSRNWVRVVDESNKNISQNLFTTATSPPSAPVPAESFEVETTNWDELPTDPPLYGMSVDPPDSSLKAYHDIMDSLAFVADGLHPQPLLSNSRFSDHINALEYCCRQDTVGLNGSIVMDPSMAKAVHFLLSSFVKVSWSTMTAWHTYTKALTPLSDVMLWRLTKSRKAYLNIPPSYRPTKLQISTRYPSIIDWVPWPSLRDRLITLHSANPHLDELICEIGNAYVVQTDLSELVALPQSVYGYIGVWDLVRAVNPNPQHLSNGRSAFETSETFSNPQKGWLEGFNTFQDVLNHIDLDDDESASLPALNAQALFSSRSLAIQAFKLLGMDQGASSFCLAPSFFLRHPELYDNQVNLMACGVALKPDTEELFPAPGELDADVMSRYKSLSKYALSVGNAPALS
ncbi:hypothetical protein ABEF95_008421 [Exophiala dermatitidis]